MDQFIKAKVNKTISVLAEDMVRTVCEIPEMEMLPWAYKKPQELPPADAAWQPFRRHDRVHGKDAHFWFRTTVEVPEDTESSADTEASSQVLLRLTTGADGDWDATNPQGLLYIDGEIRCGLDVNHRECVLEPGRKYDILIYFYVGMIETHIDVFLDLVKKDLRVEKLYYDLKVPYDAAMCYPETDYNHIRIIKYLEAACNRIDLRKRKSRAYYESLEEADRFLREEFYGKQCGESKVTVDYVGHTHIDVAWLWTLEQTKEKVQRTFSTVLDLMDRYPEYIFFSSQPQLFAYLMEEEPVLYERVKQRVLEGRFEVEGAMWLEADCNLSSGESLIRQIQHGKRFMKEEFGIDSHILWLPDVFGYSAALPQILQKSGVNRFVTSKISWNETDKLPYDSFYWQGVDGTEIFTYFMTARNYDPKAESDNGTTYNGDVTPAMNLGTWERYQQKEYNDDVLVTYGYGDGGGGPTAEMLEREKRLEYGIPGQPKARLTKASDFLDRVEENLQKNAEMIRRMPRWVGELYLEKHRGTYTSQAKNKRNNRKSEFLLEGAETMSAAAELLMNLPYPAKTYRRCWQTVCLNQFHDIIPGSSIHEVYEHCDEDYAIIAYEAGAEKNRTLQALAENVSESGLLVWNPNGFPSSQYIETNEGVLYAEDIPAFGYKVLPVKKGTVADGFALSDAEDGTLTLTTPYYEVQFDGAMQISRLYDRENDRCVNAPGEKLNVLRAYENYPYNYDNWEICSYYETKYWDLTDVTSVKTNIRGGIAEIVVNRRYMDSEITQTIRFYDRDRRIDFATEAEWQEDHIMLKALFPVDILTDQASCEIQYGTVTRPTHRNTSWDAAKFEVCAQKWVDLSEGGYGVSLLNDCKYGHSFLGNLMTISLIKTGTHPDYAADLGHHEFTYSLLPHKGSWREADTVIKAYELNRPFECIYASGGGNLPASFSLAYSDAKNVIFETAKEAESGGGLVLRLYESQGIRTRTTLHFGARFREIADADLMENITGVIGEGNEIEILMKPYEIRTLIVR